MALERKPNSIRTAYFIRIPNVGDLLNPSLVTALSGRETVRVEPLEQPHLLAIGSVMSGSTAHSLVWGTGVMHPDFGIGAVKPANIHALRGRLSYSAIRQSGLALDDVPLGDPGYLAPRLLGIAKAATPKFRVGIVAHYADRWTPVIRGMLNQAGVLDLNVHDSPQSFLSQMAACETVVSTSLHGLILAEALGIPNLWAKASDEIAGGAFKYNDWFSMTRRPQTAPHLLRAQDLAESLARRAELHECEIDTKSLTAAFPWQYLETLEEPSGRIFFPVSVCRSRPLPVFLISFNRGSLLKQAIIGIQQQARPTEIIVHDNGSTDQKTLNILDELEEDGVTVVRRGAITGADELNLVDKTVQDYFSNWAEPARYVVSDCDIDMSPADPRSLDVYDALLNKFRKAECAGPMLRIRDIPKSYPLYNQAMNRHIEQFWRQLPKIEIIPQGLAALLEAPIDTTFALHRAGEGFRRLKPGLRVYEPYEALHLDWYQTGIDGVYAETSSAEISHWDNRAEFASHKAAVLKYSSFYAVRPRFGMALEIYQELLADPNDETPAPSPY